MTETGDTKSIGKIEDIEGKSETGFVPLNIHTHYSLLEATTKIPELIKVGKEKKFSAMGITDSGVMYGAVEFYNKAKDAGIKPIVGCEVFLVDGDHQDRSTKQQWYYLPLLCKNLTGYQNLVKLVSLAQIEGFYYKPRINWKLLEQHSEGLIALSGDLAGVIGRPFLRGNTEEAYANAQRLHAIFGDDFYIELQDHDKEGEYRLSTESIKIADELNVELVATNSSRFTRAGEHEVHSILLCMQEGKTVHESNRGSFYGPEYYIKSGEELALKFNHLDSAIVKRAIDNTGKVADKCNLELQQGVSILPEYPLPKGTSEAEELERVVYEHARKRYGEVNPDDTVDKRLKYELGIINQMGFPAYFLITWEFIHWARELNIPVGPGRGSAAGSLVAYVLGITNLDPLEHNLLFERFLNPERVSMPDIDIDFCIERREEVIQHVRDLYGKEKVCQIATFGTLAARAALKAVARVMDIPFAESDRLAKMIPATPGTKLKDALEKGMELAIEYEAKTEVKELVDLALKLEGTACNVGTHAAGVVISKDPLMDIVPIQKSKDGQVISQYTMGDLERLGLLKMDFLGLRNLTIIDNTVRWVKDKKGVALEIDSIPLDDEKVYAMLSLGDTDGVFQLESSGMKQLEKDLKPSTFEDINALVALFRPGPLNSGMAKQFVDRKHGRSEIVFPHPDLEPILESTYGTVVYQEQIMQIAQILAGYSLGRADLLRRAMGKKKADVMAKERDGFVEGCNENSVPESLSNELFDMMSEFAAYCFNRSHSAAYAFVAYQTAYLKVHYPVEYLSALLSSVRNDLDKIQYYMLTARRMGIKILAPDVMTSGAEFTPDGEAIRFGLASVKNVGMGVVEEIVKARDEKLFDSLEDFLRRVDTRVLNRKTMESLIRCGAFSEFGESRKRLLENVETLIQFGNRIQEQKATGQSSLFDLMTDQGMETSGLMLSGDPSEYDNETIQQAEKELLGFYVSSHPLDSLIDQLPMMVTHQANELKSMDDGTKVILGGLLSKVQKRITRKGTPMMIATLEDLTAPVEIVAFSSVLEKAEPFIVDGQKVIVEGKLSFRGDDKENYSIIIDEVRPIDEVKPLNLFFEQIPRYEDIALLGNLLAKARGSNPVILNIKNECRIKTGAQFWVSNEREQLETTLKNHFGPSLCIV